MLFSSLEFLYLFLPATVILYFISPRCAKNTVLLLTSLIFYASGEPKYIFLMLGTLAIGFIFGLLVDRRRHSEKFCRMFLIIAVSFNVLLLVFFKYYDLAASYLPFIEPLGIVLPIGISFYTFQLLSYVADVYKGECAASRSIISFSTYISFFPQLIAGPIVKYTDVSDALKDRKHSFYLCATGTRRFFAGLSKKVLLANAAGEMWERLCALEGEYAGVFTAWLGIIFYAFQIYFDFSGYSDMAIGLGKIFGFDFPENFNYPYVCNSISDFWRRWHITLSSFFKEYVYIPLGGNRKGKVRTYINLLVVWALTGLWHGASLNFLLWGLYYFVLLVIEKSTLGKKILKKLPAALRHIYSLVAVLFGWVIFASDTLGFSGVSYILRMIGLGGAPFFGAFDAYELSRNGLLLFIMIIGATPIPKRLFYKLFKNDGVRLTVANSLTLACLFICTAKLVSSGYNPFLYFRF